MHVDPKDGRQNLFRVVLQFINPSSISVSGSIKATHSRGISGEAASDGHFVIELSDLTHHSGIFIPTLVDDRSSH